MSQAKTQMVKSSFGGHLSPTVHIGSSSSSSSTPSHVDDDSLANLNFGNFGLSQNLHLYQNQSWSTTAKNSTHENSSSTSSSSSNWSSAQVESNMMLDELLKNSSAAQSSLNEQQQRNNDLTDSNWSPFSSIQQSSEPSAQWSSSGWQAEAEFAADWSAKKPQQVPPQAQSKSWAKIVSQQSSPSTNGANQTTNQKNELSHEWDIKVNQTVPWSLEPNNQNQTQTVVPSSSTSSAASSSSSSTSSISSNDKLINNLIQFNKDRGTEIWHGNSNKTLWEQKETPEHNWSPNQQAPQWNTGWNESWSSDQTLVQHQQQIQHQQQMMAKIEPTGWDDPDFKQIKKSDDGTAIWGDPEQAKMIKIQKWSYSTKHVPNPATTKPDSEFSSQCKAQSQFPTSSWNNTPAAPILNDLTNEMKSNSDWNSDLVDTKSWLKENKSEHEWDQGRVDTSSWGINIASTKNNFDPSIGVVDTSKWSNGTQVANSTSQVTAPKPSSQSNTPGLLNMANAGTSAQDWSPNMFRDEEARKLSRMNSHPSCSNLLNQNRANNKMPLNFANQTPAPTNPLLCNNLSQSQLLDSFQLAVQSNLISPDLLNIRLPSDVIALLNQLFQTLNSYTNNMNRIKALNKRHTQLNPQQLKVELEMLNQDNQTHKENLLIYQKKINNAHMLLKQQQQQMSSGAGNLMADVNSISLDLLKENQNQTKLMQLIQEQKMAQFVSQKSNRQQPQMNKVQQQLSQNSLFTNSNASTPVGTGQWPGFNSFMNEQQPQIDDRITPFVPGKPWAGQGQSSIEDDPNCTPGSFSKPLLTETIDPETILSNLTRGNNWSSSVDFLGANQSSLLGMSNNNNNNNINGNNNGSRFAQRNTWGQNNFNSLNNSIGSTSGTIGEQLWGVRNNSNRNAINANSPSNIRPNQFNQLINQQQQQQQQFYRSNSWNIGPGSTGSGFNNPSQLNINSGHYLLIRNVTPQMDQSTLKALCAQYAIGQLTYYKYIPNKSCVIVRYNTKEETNIAHAKLNSTLLCNTTINTQLLSENDFKYELF